VKPKPRYQINDTVIVDDTLHAVAGGKLENKEWKYYLTVMGTVHMQYDEIYFDQDIRVISECDLLLEQQKYGPKYTWEFVDNEDGTGYMKGTLTSGQ